MANRFSTILLPADIHDLPQGYAQTLKQFNGERGYSAEEHLGWFSNWTNLEEVDHDGVKVRLLAQSLAGEARKWFKNILDNSILNYQSSNDSFKEKWADKKNPKHYLSQYHSMRRRESESIQDLFDRFIKIYNATPT